jgi:hypothetical protein
LRFTKIVALAVALTFSDVIYIYVSHWLHSNKEEQTLYHIHLDDNTDVITHSIVDVFSDDGSLYLEDISFQEPNTKVYDLKRKTITKTIPHNLIPKNAHHDRFDFDWVEDSPVLYRLFDIDKNITLNLKEGYQEYPFIASKKYIIPAIKNRLFIYDKNLHLLKMLRSKVASYIPCDIENETLCYEYSKRGKEYIFHLYNIKTDTTKDLNITFNNDIPFEPRIFLKGSYIIFDFATQLVIYNIQTNKSKLIDKNIRYSHRTEDDHIIFISRADKRLYLFDKGHLEKLKDNVSLAEIDGKNMLYITQGQIHLKTGQKDTLLHSSFFMNKFIHFAFNKKYALLAQRNRLLVYDLDTHNYLFSILFDGIYRNILGIQGLKDGTVVLLFKNMLVKIDVESKKITKEIRL